VISLAIPRRIRRQEQPAEEVELALEAA
jgi:hypothetical protein